MPNKISHLALIVECVAIFGAGVASGQGRIQLDGGEKRFINETLGFSIGVPSGWSVTPDRDAPIFTNFRPSEAHAQLELPRGGAIIIVDQGPPGALSKPLSQWAKEDVRGLSSGAPSVGSFVPPAAAEITDAISITFDTATFGPDDQKQHCVSVYWEFRRQRFSAHLSYVFGDPRGRAHERVLLEAVRSFRPFLPSK
jgi:hypothetical protein